MNIKGGGNDEEETSASSPGRLVPMLWAGIKLAGLAVAAPMLAPAIVLQTVINTREIKRRIDALPKRLTQAADGEEVPGLRTAVVPADKRYLVTSDIHRNIEGNADWPERQETKQLYSDVLDRYTANDDWTLIENGDVEELWMVGGSPAGVLIEARSWLVGGLGRFLDEGVSNGHVRQHLEAVYGNNPRAASQLRALAAQGRYLRTVGNHDAAVGSGAGRSAITAMFPGVDPVDVVVFRNGTDRPAAFVAHGHHTDTWTAPGIDEIGRLASSFGSAMQDMPTFPTPGMPTPAMSASLLAGRARSVLLRVSPLFGTSLSQHTTDERWLHDAWFDHFEPVAEGGPQLILGHTHEPGIDKVDTDGVCWHGYVNGGSSVTHRLLTMVEWDGTKTDPEATLVAWDYRDDGSLRRQEITRDPDSLRLILADSEPLDLDVVASL